MRQAKWFLILLAIFMVNSATLAQTVRTIRIGQTVTGNILTSGQINLFRFTVTGGPKSIVIQMGGFDTYLELKDATGTVLASNDDSGDPTWNSRIAMQLPNGVYTIVARGYSSQTGAYQLRVSQEVFGVRTIIIEQNAVGEGFGTITGDGSGTVEYHWVVDKPGGVRFEFDSGPLTVSMSSGSASIPAYSAFPTDLAGDYQALVRITAPSTLESNSIAYTVRNIAVNRTTTRTIPSGVRDLYAFTVTGGPLAMIIQMGGFDTYLQLFDASGQLLASNDDGGQSPWNSEIQMTLPNGRYIIGARGYGGGGTYQLRLSRGVAFRVGGVVIGWAGGLGSGSMSGTGTGPVTYNFVVVTPSGTRTLGPYSVTMAGSLTLPAYPDFPLLEGPGQYQIQLQVTSPNAISSNTLTYSVTSIALGQTLNGTIAIPEEQRYFTFEVSDGPQRISVDLGGFDTFLELRDGLGSSVATDDDSGVSPWDSHIQGTLDEGVYYIVARGLGVATGTYHVMLSRTAAEAFSIGDKVRVREDVTDPFYGWGDVSPGEVGTVVAVDLHVDSGRLTVDFPSQSGWFGATSDMEHVDLDVDGDGLTTISDAIMILEVIAGDLIETGNEDVDGSGTVDIQDALLVLRSLPSGKLVARNGQGESLRVTKDNLGNEAFSGGAGRLIFHGMEEMVWGQMVIEGTPTEIAGLQVSSPSSEYAIFPRKEEQGMPGRLTVDIVRVQRSANNQGILPVVFKTEGEFPEAVFSVEQAIFVGRDVKYHQLEERVELKLQNLPKTFALLPNYPNPFNPTSAISYALPEATEVQLAVYNAVGQRVKVLVQDAQEAGFYTTEWNGRDERGQEAASGVYFYRLEAGSFQAVGRMMLMR